jgi:CMP-N-acetylneuraminic acid synthetase
MEGNLTPEFNDFGNSMIRRQDMKSSYKVYSTDVFRFKGQPLGSSFLGNKVFGLEISSLYGLDIDGELDFEIVRLLIENKIVDLNKL